MNNLSSTIYQKKKHSRVTTLPELRAMTDLAKTADRRVEQLNLLPSDDSGTDDEGDNFGAAGIQYRHLVLAYGLEDKSDGGIVENASRALPLPSSFSSSSPSSSSTMSISYRTQS